MIYVTHDQVEAMTLADRIVVLNKGIIEQVGTPIELYKSPKNQFVAEFIGSPKMNIINLQGENKSSLSNINPPNNSSKLGIRPEHLFIDNDNKSKLSGVVRHIENLGEHLLCYIKIEGEQEITAKLNDNSKVSTNELVKLNWQSENTHFFDSLGNSVK